MWEKELKDGERNNKGDWREASEEIKWSQEYIINIYWKSLLWKTSKIQCNTL